MTFEILPLFTTMLILSLKAAVLVAAILFVRKWIGGRLSPAWRHALWAVVPLQLLFCVSVPSPWSVQNLWTENTGPATVIPAKNDVTIPLSPYSGGGLGWGAEPLTDANTPTLTLPRKRERGMPNIVTGASGFIAVWLFGVIVMALVFLRQTLLCRRWMREAEQVESEAVLRIFKECAKRMKVRTWLVIAESRSVCGPLLIGTIRPTLLLPHGLVESATPQQLRTVLLHELAHLKRWDVWTGWLMTVLLTLHWFNPLLWLAVRKMNADREEAADELALRTMEPVERPDYGRALIDIAQHFITPARTPGLVGISETGKNLTRRIEMLNRTESWKLRWKILALLAVLVLGVTTMTDAQTRSPAEIQADIDRLQAELKEAETKEPKVEPSKVVRRNFRVDVAQDSLQVDGKKMTIQELVRLLKDVKNETIKTVVLTLDSKANYGDLLKVIETLASQEIENLQFTIRKSGQDALPGPHPGREGDDLVKPSSDNVSLPKIFPLLKFLGEFAGMEGDDPIRFEFILTVVEKGNTDFDRLDGKAFVSEVDGKTYKVSDSLLVRIHEGEVPQTPGWVQDDFYLGKLLYVGPNELELRVEKYFDDGKKEKPVPKALKSVPIKVIGEGENMVLEIPKNAEWDKIRLERVKKFALTASVAPTGTIAPKDALPGSYLGWEGDDRIGIEIGEPKNNFFPITIYEDGLPGKGFDPNDDDRYEGTAVAIGDKLEITLAKKFDDGVDGGVEEPVEKTLRKLSATLGSENGKTTLAIPKNREWDAVKVTKVEK